MCTDTWQRVILGNHADIRARIGWRGLSATEYTKEGPYLIAGHHIANGLIEWTACDHIPEWRYRESHEIVLREGDVILTKDGTIGRVALVKNLPSPATVNGTMMLLRPRKGLDSAFLYHYLNSNAFQKIVQDKVSGSSIPHIFQRDMIGLSLPLPKTNEQSAIAVVLDMVDEAIQQTAAVIEKLKKIKAGLLHDLLTRGIDENGQLRDPIRHPKQFKDSPLGKVPKKWEIIRCQDVMKLNSGKMKTQKQLAAEKGNVPVFGGNGITGYTTSPLVTEPTLVIGRVGEYCGNVQMTTGPAWITDNALYATKIREGFALRFLVLCLEAFDLTRLQIATGQPLVTQGGIGAIWLKRPDTTEQSAIAEVVRTHSARIEAETDFQQKLTLIKQGLMQDILTGRVRVPMKRREGKLWQCQYRP